ncbi:cation diffusion facilitator family transporter [Undibacterium sp. RTI2.1]|uniref:cation diffusion facilitator family transporter n=1 Tax=unclassified Undibacterium TaxID=2630295 RepID=UPI002AB5DB37|nr:MULTISPECIES: cation diffusion facilitator family transporter [unclassified Undibacterium]MDY7537410.1 cation diffusion facilitator family transporter [Undibacterium sp. 5I1]MEB0031205.1 cation diffusion facilitator family transporter [Undibacterium sp. RTI2.1]MEB0117584.1 cation diffusion facilitator family transporter [Undibacterium sp. RTI2.2]MEB0232280.1 cation diffusion facilitator family transporter [Undibacterium sp. 10I3]MEB0259794.1 cation diffusion facilitator family transporter [
MATNASSKQVIYAALIGNILVAITKASAATWTGSAAMWSEAVHSFVDTGNELLLLYGICRAERQADAEHPIGYGRELYFWSFIVALLVFALGAGVSIYEGILHLLAPQAIHDPIVSYVVLGLAFVFDGTSWLISLKQFKASKGTLGYYEAFRHSKDPASFIVLFEDSVALIGIVIAAFSTYLATNLGMLASDGIASVLIGLILAGTAGLLARESKSLLIGERADRQLSDSMLSIANQLSPSVKTNGVLTVQLAPDQILAAMSIEFADDLTTSQIETLVVDIETQIRASHPEVVTFFVKPQTAAAFKASVQRRFGLLDSLVKNST